MAAYSVSRRRRFNWARLVLGLVGLIVVAAAVTGFVLWHNYSNSLKPLDNDQTAYPIIIPSGSTSQQIADKLKLAGMIRNPSGFTWYVRLHHLGSKLQAGTYSIKSSYSIPKIANLVAEGKIERNYIIILPAQRIDQIKDVFVNAKFSKAAIDAAFDADRYRDIPVLADLPAGANLEGYLYPDTFQMDTATGPSAIIRESLQEMDSHVTADVKASWAAEGLNIHQAISLASVVENEVAKPSDRTQVAQVFLLRLKQGMRLQSDITANYAAHIGNDAYNLYNHDGLPPGPISNVSDVSLQAVAHPADTHWLYFVTGDNGTTYFSTNAQEHEKLTQQYCHKLCGQ